MTYNPLLPASATLLAERLIKAIPVAQEPVPLTRASRTATTMPSTTSASVLFRDLERVTARNEAWVIMYHSLSTDKKFPSEPWYTRASALAAVKYAQERAKTLRPLYIIHVKRT